MTQEDLSHNMSVMSRMGQVIFILESVIAELKGRVHSIAYWQEEDDACRNDTSEKRSASVAIESLTYITDRLRKISSISDIVSETPVLIPAIRTVGSSLYPTMPQQSRDLSLASSTLGSVTMDSGVMVGALFNLRHANTESARILDEARAAVDSRRLKV